MSMMLHSDILSITSWGSSAAKHVHVI